ncbi:MAG: tyrosine-type recombinase/integrase [Chloroflexota bacterium]
MFESLFCHPVVIRRHVEGPWGRERAAYLERLASLGYRRSSLLRRAAYVFCVARELAKWPPEYRLTQGEVDAMASAWACERPRAKSPTLPRRYFRLEAMEFLRFLDRLIPEPPAPAGRYDRELEEFLTAQRQDRGLSAETCRGLQWQVKQFLAYVEGQGIALADLRPTHVDGFFLFVSQRWSRRTLHKVAGDLRTWFRYAEAKGWVRHGLAESVEAPRVYREEGLPLGPTWEQVQRLLADVEGDRPKDIRDRAILLLLLVYGFRSDEVRRLSLDDIDWEQDLIRLRRAKSFRLETFPIEPTVGNALVRYLREARPKSENRVVFLTVRAPFRPLSSGGLYNAVRERVDRLGVLEKGRGPHGLRHACARHLVESGLSLKGVGDHLGHRSASSTRIYAKVDMASLRRVAFEDLGGLR